MPGLVAAYYQLGWVYTRMKQADDAKLTFAKFEGLRTYEKRRPEVQTCDIVRRLANVRF